LIVQARELYARSGRSRQKKENLQNAACCSGANEKSVTMARDRRNRSSKIIAHGEFGNSFHHNFNR
jgi:hypothetical protein